ncbi:tRNA (N6-threonylcarbamoyladenosine(37)-N6)-methyltransferase TrmO [Rhizobium tubonense]|uniref:tRNA (N6-threonylcarbamoyladenosine(37)-N6)-methyltransferase TrmO n=1 Tax=Rhizobium tubonense TaxID=484088 RepID=A0A2W4E646_9HYPH|nr:tRNA (N6-threonylcarbamoyladenosine(37)-N6)-methyltransferase TrmO [Rhizobium tubonense]PZM07360.1 tRNA (N6-threonylcarbamoyladenosine(37)-N6)-methyltransferase TrmO [Rhizobium tubonense]
MVRENEIRKNEVAIEPPPTTDAGLVFIGRISTPWTSRLQTPRQGRHDGPICRIEIFEPWALALRGVEALEQLEILYWLDRSRGDLVLQSPASNGTVHGTFSLRSPVRPNPIGTSIVKLEAIEGAMLLVRGLDCLDGTPLIDIKPDRTLFKPIAPPQPGDSQTGDEGTAHYCQKV